MDNGWRLPARMTLNVCENDWRMKENGHATRRPDKALPFASRDERARRRAARNVRSQHHALGLPLVVWEGGEVVERPA